MRTLFGVAVTVLVAATLAGCAAQSSSDPSVSASQPAQKFSGIGGAKTEYEKATTTYLLPPGVAYPPAPFTDSTGSYQAGYGSEAAVTFWNCAWGKAYLQDQAVDPDKAATDLNQYAAVQNTDTFKEFWDPESIQKPFKASIESAKLGDPSAIEQNVSANCE